MLRKQTNDGYNCPHLNQCIVCICEVMEMKEVYGNICNFYAADKIGDAPVQGITFSNLQDQITTS